MREFVYGLSTIEQAADAMWAWVNTVPMSADAIQGWLQLTCGVLC